MQSAEVTVLFSTFQGTADGVSGVEISNGGAIYIDWALDTNIEDCEFYDMKGVEGGAIYYAPVSTSWAYAIEQKDGREENYNFEINNCHFERCTAEQHGGSLFFKNTQLIRVRQSNFVESRAGENGGAIYFWCDPVSIEYQKDNEVTCQLNLANGLAFTDCSAR